MKTFLKIGLLSVAWISEQGILLASSFNTFESTIQDFREQAENLRKAIEQSSLKKIFQDDYSQSTPESPALEKVNNAIDLLAETLKSSSTKTPPTPSTELLKTLNEKEQGQVNKIALKIYSYLGESPEEEAIRTALIQCVIEEANTVGLSLDDPSIDKIFAALVIEVQKKYSVNLFEDYSSFKNVLSLYENILSTPTTMALDSPMETFSMPIAKGIKTLVPTPLSPEIEPKTPLFTTTEPSVQQTVNIQPNNLIEPATLPSSSPQQKLPSELITPTPHSQIQVQENRTIILPNTPETQPKNSTAFIPTEISRDSDPYYLNSEVDKIQDIFMENDDFEPPTVVGNNETKNQDKEFSNFTAPLTEETSDRKEQTIFDTKPNEPSTNKPLMENDVIRPLTEPDLPQKRKQSRDDEEIREPAEQVVLFQSFNSAEEGNHDAPHASSKPAPSLDASDSAEEGNHDAPHESSKPAPSLDSSDSADEDNRTHPTENSEKASKPAPSLDASDSIKKSKNNRDLLSSFRPIPSRMLNLLQKAPQQALKPRRQNISIIEIESNEEITRTNLLAPNKEQITLRVAPKPEADQSLKETDPLMSPKTDSLKVSEEQSVNKETLLDKEIVPLQNSPIETSDKELVPLEKTSFPNLQDFQNATMEQPTQANVQSAQTDKISATRILALQNENRTLTVQKLNTNAEIQTPNEQQNISPDGTPTPWESNASFTSHYPNITSSGSSFFTKTPNPTSEVTLSHSAIIFHG